MTGRKRWKGIRENQDWERSEKVEHEEMEWKERASTVRSLCFDSSLLFIN